MRQKKQMQDSYDMKEIIDSKGESLSLDFRDFYQVERQVSQAQYAKNKPKLSDVASVRFIKGSTEIFWKKSHKENAFRSSEFLPKKKQSSQFMYHSSRYLNQGVSIVRRKKTLRFCFPTYNKIEKCFGWICHPLIFQKT